MSVLKKPLSSSAVRYGLVGIANTIFGLMMIYFAKFLGVGDIFANLFGYCCGLILSFRLNSKWTFRYKGHLLSAFYKFCAVILVSYFLNLAVVLTAIHQLSVNSYLAQALGIIPYTIASYVGSRYLVFRNDVIARARATSKTRG
jgi:putative flippase GtrA